MELFKEYIFFEKQVSMSAHYAFSFFWDKDLLLFLIASETPSAGNR